MSVKQMGIVWELDLEHSKKLVLLAYADHADDDGDIVFPSLGRIAHKTGYSRDQARRISKGLKDDILMELVEPADAATQRPARYRLTLQNGTLLGPFKARGASSTTPPAPPSHPGANGPPHLGAPVPPEPSLEPSVNNASKEAASSAGPPPDGFEGWHVEEYIREELTRLDKDWTRTVVRRYTR